MIQYGIHPVNTLLTTQPELVEEIGVLQSSDNERVLALIKLAKAQGIRVIQHSKQAFNHAVGQGVHQGVFALCKKPASYDEADLMQMLKAATTPLLFLVLDSVQDPHNVGACLRSANAFGANAVIAPKSKAAGLTPVVRKVACGAAELTPFIAVPNLTQTLKKLQQAGVWTIGLDLAGEQSIQDMDFNQHTALILGNEGSGLRRLTKAHCDFLVRLPMQGQVESLNVSVTAGVCLYEARRGS